MDYSINTRPLLQSETESDFEDDILETNSVENINDHVIITRDTKPLFKVREHADKYNLSYFIFYLLGMTTLLPWNFFITADDYWKYKFRDINSNFTQLQMGLNLNNLEYTFISYLSIASSVPNTVFLILNTFLSHKVNLQIRMIGSLSVMILLFIITTSFVRVDTDSWQENFFIFTIAIVVLLNIASAILQGGLFGLVGKFPSRYITAVVSGQALGGIFAAGVEIITLSGGTNSKTSALLYFLIAIIILVLSLISYIILSNSIFFRFHIKSISEISTLPSSGETSNQPPTISYWTILKKIWLHCFSIWNVFFVTITIFPAVTVLVSSFSKGNNNPWNDTYFVPVVSYFIFSLCDYIGRLLAGWIQRPTSGWIVGLVSILRIAFIPIIMMSNAQPRSHLPVVVTSDIYYILIIIAFALSNGYLANMALISAPKIVESYEQETASSMMATFLGIGVTSGSTLSIFIVKLL